MALSGYLGKRGLKDGVLGGRRGWLILGVVMWSGRLLKKVLNRPSELISVERLEPGQSISVSAHNPKDTSASSRRTRRRATGNS